MDLFHWDNANKRLGIGTNAPMAELDVEGNAKVSADTIINKAGYDYMYETRAGNTTITGDGVLTYVPLGVVELLNIVRWTFPIPVELHGENVRITAGTFYYTLVGNGHILENYLAVYNASDGTTTDIDADAVDITAGTSHSFSNLPSTPLDSETEPMIVVELHLQGKTGDAVGIRGIQLSFDN